MTNYSNISYQFYVSVATHIVYMFHAEEFELPDDEVPWYQLNTVIYCYQLEDTICSLDFDTKEDI